MSTMRAPRPETAASPTGGQPPRPPVRSGLLERLVGVLRLAWTGHRGLLTGLRRGWAAVRRLRVSQVLARRVLLANLVAQVGIVVTGGAVRLTGSGLGCPTWPECVEGSYTPTLEQALGIHPYIEFGNRLLTFVVALTALAALLVVLLRRRRGLHLLAAAPLLGVVTQAVIGGITVHLELHPAVVATHFLVSTVLITVSTALLLRLGEDDGPPRRVVPVPVVRLVQAVGVLAGAVLVLGTIVTGSGPHSGDAAAPARLGFDTQVVSRLHADAVVVFLVLVVALLVVLRRTGAPPTPRRRAWWVLGITLAQGVVGWVQYATDLPELLVGLHMLGAAVLVIAVTALVLGARTRSLETVPGRSRSGGHVVADARGAVLPG